ncbi:MAG: hypothetical protein LBH10_04010 [Burkholderiaceae bacterium]|jgi:hypothetical protein|nr:hypothetical protein [Burkholderiaceae bacterium]
MDPGLFLITWILVPLATIAIFEGSRRISWRRTAWKSAVFLIFGVVVLGGMTGAQLWGVSTLNSIARTLTFVSVPLPPVSDATLAQMTPQNREIATRLRARMTFERTGAFTTYISASGQHIQYAPSEKEISGRETATKVRTEIRIHLEYMRGQFLLFMIAGVVAVVVGMYARSCERSNKKL